MVRRGEKLDVNGEIRTTLPPISCLLEWDSPDCRIVDRQPPMFAPNFARPHTKAKHGSCYLKLMKKKSFLNFKFQFKKVPLDFGICI